MYLHLNINYLRKMKGMSQIELAGVLEKNPTSVSSYENKKALPPLDVILQMCEIFNVSLEDIVFKNMKEEGVETVQFDGDKVEKMKDRLIELLEEKVAKYETIIKRDQPEVAKELGLK